MDFGTSSSGILNCDISVSSQESQIAQCLESLESPAAGISGGTSAACTQNGSIHVSSIPTWLSNGMLGTSTSDTQSTGALPPVSELRPGFRARGSMQLWTLLAQMASGQTGSDTTHVSASPEKHVDDVQSCTIQNAAAYHIDTSAKTQTTGQNHQHHSYETEASYSYCDIQRSNIPAVEPLSSLGMDIEQAHNTVASLDVDSITSAYQQYSCIPLLNIPNSNVSSEQQSSLNGILDDTLYCTAKSNHSIPSLSHVQTAQELRQNGSPSNVAKLITSNDGSSVQHLLNEPRVSGTHKALSHEAEVATSLLSDSASVTSGPVSATASVTTKLPQLASSQSRDCSSKNYLPRNSFSSNGQNEQVAPRHDKKTFSTGNLVEEVVCYRCKVCMFLHESKSEVVKHAESHRHGTTQPTSTMQRRFAQQVPQQVANRAEKRFLCGKCRRGFFTLDDCCRHLSQAHQAKSKKIRLEWIYTNQPDQMRASTPAEEATLPEPVPVREGAPKQPILPEFKAGPPEEPAHGAPKQTVKPVCTVSKKKEENRKTSPSELSDSSISSSQMAWRQKINREQGSFICERKGCNVRFRELENLEYHVRCHRADKPDFVCPECSVVCLRWRTMTGHLWRHHLCDMELHQCDQCDFRTYSLSKLENSHKRTHGEERPFLCDVCGKGFKTGKQLRNHKTIHRQASGQWSTVAAAQGNGGTTSLPAEACSECGRCFRVRRLLQLHRDSVHRKLRPFLCSYCGHRASSQSSLKMHLRQHTGEKPFACNLCEYRTGDHNSLRRHKMRHSGTKPYKCPHCPYACIQSSTYKSHLHRKHPGQSDSLLFACPLCSFRTVREDNYKAHLSDHSASEAQSRNDAAAVASADQTFNLSSALTLGDIVGFAQSAS